MHLPPPSILFIYILYVGPSLSSDPHESHGLKTLPPPLCFYCSETTTSEAAHHFILLWFNAATVVAAGLYLEHQLSVGQGTLQLTCMLLWIL